MQVKQGKKKRAGRTDLKNRSSNKQTEIPVLPSLKAWQTGGLILALGVIAIAGLIWKCTRDPSISFLTRHDQAEWILFPRAMDSSGHQVADVDTTFTREFVLNGQPQAARLDLRAAKRAELKINGAPVPIATGRNWKDAISVEAGAFLRAGKNSIEIKVFNDTAPPALWLALSSDQLNLRSDESWQASCAGSPWRPVALATVSRMPGPGNTMAGGEKTFPALRKVWPIWLVFLGIAAAICIAVYRWFPRVLEQSADGGLTPRQMTIILVAIATLWVFLYCNNAVLVPFRHGFDAQEHSEYITYIQQHHALPLPTDGFEMFQPPLYYVISATALSICGLSVDDHAGNLVLRFLTLLFGILQFILVFLSLRFLFRDRFTPQLIGLLLAAFLPMQIYLSHYVTNETLAATLVTASVYLALRLLGTKNPSTSQFAWLGLCLGAAMLSKATGLLAVFIIFVAVAAMLVLRSAPVATWMRHFGTMSAVFLAVCGWHYLRIWIHFGNPLVGNWDKAAGFLWWQDPGYHVTSDYVGFGKSLVAPLFSGFWTFADGIYSTLWGDGLVGGVPSLSFRPPWNYNLMVAGYLWALVPAMVILTGVAVSLWRFLHKPSVEWFILFGLAGAVAFGVVFMTLKVACYGQVKAFYGLATLVPLCFFGAVGWEVLTSGRRILQGALGILLLAWAINSFASFWVVRSSTLHVYSGFRLGAEGRLEETREEAARAVAADPSNATARQFLSFVLNESGRTTEALPEAQRTVELNPTDGNCHLQLGVVLAQQNQLEPAINEARRALELEPENWSAYTVLQSCLSRLERSDEAVGVARDALAQYPFNADLHYNLGVVLAHKEDYVAASNQFVYALLMRPNYPQARSNLRIALRSIGKTSDGAKHLNDLVLAAPDSPVVLGEIAWFFATQSDPALRNGAEAVRLAEHARAQKGGNIPQMLPILAAAYAETARFPEAINMAKEARLRAQSSGDTETGKLTDRLLAAFENGRPYREEGVQK